jgi:FkbM family methyltransferase
LFRIVHQRLGLRARAVLTTAEGVRIEIDCANTAFLDYASRLAGSDGYEPEIGGLLAHLAPRLRVVFDVGANWGYHSLLLGTDARFAGSIHAFEIRQRTAADLRRVIAGAGLGDRVSVHAFGLSAQAGEVRISRERHSYLVRILAADDARASEPAEIRRLDELGLPPPDLMKIDVEAHEAAVLRGAAAVLERVRPVVIFESWHDPADSEAMLEPLHLLQRFGYELYRPEWRPLREGGGEPGEDRAGGVDLVPLAVADRPAIAATLNLLAVQPARWEEFFGAGPA